MLTTQRTGVPLAATQRASATAPILGSVGDTLMPLDLGRLLSTRLLIQAASNGGKSWALRRILEQTHGRVQQLVIDPEGELVTLAERYDYIVCAPEGGDAPLAPDNGAAVARTLFLSGRSAILSINDLGLDEMRRFVADFLKGLLAIPKDAWNFALIAIDEGQLFAPQHDKAESKKPMIDLATRGRKRGLGSVFATQRIAMLNKGVVASSNGIGG
jgi:DNA helicase HerA-like ATPase